jgi:NAD(P)-dependent dehydrogenase (short-subunit alcohol dehydrogenase family)
MELAGRSALVTGSGVRVGRALALALGARGMRVAVHYHGSEAGAHEVAREIERAGGHARCFQADLSQPDGPTLLAAQVLDAFGGLDVLVNSAALMLRTPFGEVSPEQWERIFALNLRAPFFAAQAAARAMGERGGAIVNIADLAAFETWPAYVPHGISKAGVVNLTRSLARVLAPKIRVNGIAPGTVLLPEQWDPGAAEHLRSTTPLQRQGSPEDVVRTMLFLLDSDYVTGETIIVDGGRHVRH